MLPDTINEPLESVTKTPKRRSKRNKAEVKHGAGVLLNLQHERFANYIAPAKLKLTPTNYLVSEAKTPMSMAARWQIIPRLRRESRHSKAESQRM